MTIAPALHHYYSSSYASKNGDSFENCLILYHSVELILGIRVAPYAHKALVWSFVQPAIFTSLNLHVRT